MSNEIKILIEDEFCKGIIEESKPDNYNKTPPSEQKDKG